MIANIWIGIPFNLVLLYSGLQSIPQTLYEAAAIDGATAWQRFRRITFPLLRPVSAITLLLGLIYTLKVFDIIWIMTRGGPADSSTTFATWSYRLGFGNLLPAFGPAPRWATCWSSSPWSSACSTSAPSERQAHGMMPATEARTAWSARPSIGIVLTAVMLFPVYWMINVSFTRDQDMRKTPPICSRCTARFEGYRAVLAPTAALPRHQPDRRAGHRRCSPLVLSRARRILAGQAAPARRRRAQLPAAGRADDPRHHHGDGLLRHPAQHSPAQHRCRGWWSPTRRIAVPFGVLVFTAFMSGIPDELMQAAQTDGAGACAPSGRSSCRSAATRIVTVSLFTFLWAWSDFIFASTLDSGGDRQPITLGIYHYIGNNNQQWNAIMATAVVASVPATVLLVLAQRYVAAGMTTGAVKD